MTTVKKMIDDIIKREGGYVNHKADKGGPTKYGITLATLSAYLNKRCTDDDVKKLSKELAAEIYEKNYYRLPKIDQLPVEIQDMLFDMSINHGAKRAVKILQTVLIEFNFSIGKIDGVIGMKTIDASKQMASRDQRRFINELVSQRVEFYHDIVKSNPSQEVFLNGWLNRANSFAVR